MSLMAILRLITVHALVRLEKDGRAIERSAAVLRVSDVRFCLGDLGACDQMAILGKDLPRLQTPRVMQRRKQPLKQAASGRRLGMSDRRASISYGGIDRRRK
jgi:hypothetical protein